jgi:hypothetical protein
MAGIGGTSAVQQDFETARRASCSRFYVDGASAGQ